MMNKKKFKVGIAGYGVVGQRRQEFIDRNPFMRTVAVCDQKFKKPGMLDQGVSSFRDYKTLLDQPLDILFVSLPNYLASIVTIAGLKRGMHVFCEKPPGCNVEDILKVIDIEKRFPRLKLKYGFNHRYHDSVREAIRLVNSGHLGKIINLRGVYGKSKILSFASGWRAKRKFSGGGILLDQGIHMVDLMRLFCGDFIDLRSYVSNDYWKHDVEDNVYVIMRNKNNVVAMLHSTATQWEHRFSLEITLTEGYLELQGILSGSKSYGQERLVIGRRQESDTGTAKEKIITYLDDNSWRDEINEFADVIVNDRPVKSGTSAEALATMKSVYRIYYADPLWRKRFKIKNPD